MAPSTKHRFLPGCAPPRPAGKLPAQSRQRGEAELPCKRWKADDPRRPRWRPAGTLAGAPKPGLWLWAGAILHQQPRSERPPEHQPPGPAGGPADLWQLPVIPAFPGSCQQLPWLCRRHHRHSGTVMVSQPPSHWVKSHPA